MADDIEDFDEIAPATLSATSAFLLSARIYRTTSWVLIHNYFIKNGHNNVTPVVRLTELFDDAAFA